MIPEKQQVSLRTGRKRQENKLISFVFHLSPPHRSALIFHISILNISLHLSPALISPIHLPSHFIFPLLLCPLLPSRLFTTYSPLHSSLPLSFFLLSLSPPPHTPLPSLDHTPVLYPLILISCTSLFLSFCLSFLFSILSLFLSEPAPRILHKSPWPQLSRQRAVLYVKQSERATQ